MRPPGMSRSTPSTARHAPKSRRSAFRGDAAVFSVVVAHDRALLRLHMQLLDQRDTHAGPRVEHGQRRRREDLPCRSSRGAVVMPAPADEVYRLASARPGAFARLTPPWHRIRVLERTGTGVRGRRAAWCSRSSSGPCGGAGSPRSRQRPGPAVRRPPGGGPVPLVGPHAPLRPGGAARQRADRPHRVRAARRRARRRGRRRAGRARRSSACSASATRASPRISSATALWSAQPRLTVAISGAERARRLAPGRLPHDRRPPGDQARAPTGGRAGRGQLGPGRRRPRPGRARRRRRRS